MKTYREFVDKIKPKEFVAFFNAGGKPELNFDLRQQTNFNENLIQREEPLASEVDSDGILRDPDKKHFEHNERLYSLENLRIGNPYPRVYCHPRLNSEQAEIAKELSKATNTGWKHYVDELGCDLLYSQFIRHYTQGHSADINIGLLDHHRMGTKPPDFDEDEVDGGFVFHIPTFDKLIDDHRLHRRITVYSGIHFDPNDHIGQIAHVPCYMSTSLTPHVAKDFGKKCSMKDFRYGFSENPYDYVKHVLRLSLPEGHPGLFTENSSLYRGQLEIILPRNVKIKINSQPSRVINNPNNALLNHFTNTLNDSQPRQIQLWDGELQ